MQYRYKIFTLSLLLFLLTFHPKGHGEEPAWLKTSGITNAYVSSIVLTHQAGIFAKVAGTGIYRSTDQGVHWTVVNSGKAISGRHFEEILDVVTDAQDNLYALDDRGMVFRSTNAGAQWGVISVTNAASKVVSLKNMPTGALFARVVYHGRDTVEIYSSLDNGMSWKQMSSEGRRGKFKGLWFLNGREILLSTTDGAFHSFDDARSWQPVSGKLSLPPEKLRKLFKTPFGRILSSRHYSDDDGESWQPFANASALPPYDGFSTIRADTHGHLFASYDRRDGIYTSPDSGRSWIKKDFPQPGLKILSFSISDAGEIYAGTMNGICRSTDDGEHWDCFRDGLYGASVLDVLPLPSGKMILSLDGDRNDPNRGLYISSDSGMRWTRLQTCSADMEPGYLFSDKQGTLYIHADSTYYSTDEGVTWERSIPPGHGQQIESYDGSTWLYFPDTVSDGSGVLRSIDRGKTWTAVPFPHAVEGACEGSKGIFYVHTKDGIFISRNGGEAWKLLTKKTCASLHTGFDTVLYAGGMKVGDRFLLCRSIDAGKTWTPIDPVRPKSLKDRLRFGVSSDHAIVCWSEQSKVYRSTDMGKTWTGITREELGDRKVFPECGGYVFINDPKYGLFRSADVLR